MLLPLFPLASTALIASTQAFALFSQVSARSPQPLFTKFFNSLASFKSLKLSQPPPTITMGNNFGKTEDSRRSDMGFSNEKLFWERWEQAQAKMKVDGWQIQCGKQNIYYRETARCILDYNTNCHDAVDGRPMNTDVGWCRDLCYCIKELKRFVDVPSIDDGAEEKRSIDERSADEGGEKWNFNHFKFNLDDLLHDAKNRKSTLVTVTMTETAAKGAATQK